MANNVWTDFVSRYYGDTKFASTVDKNPTEAMRNSGIPLPEDKEIRFVKNTDKVLHYVLPSCPIADLSDAELNTVAGGTGETPAGNTPGIGGTGPWGDQGWE